MRPLSSVSLAKQALELTSLTKGNEAFASHLATFDLADATHWAEIGR